ncbi:MAG TPA: HNH endonuclease [Pseudonocardiaceae bacterium]|nr:HNH endonuclease [Pseudonocardiaceae bacterium]
MVIAPLPIPIMYKTVGPADTVDHIVPLSRGGVRTSWLNTVACCGGGPRSCNARKGNRLLAEAGLRLRSTHERRRGPRSTAVHPPDRGGWQRGSTSAGSTVTEAEVVEAR